MPEPSQTTALNDLSMTLYAEAEMHSLIWSAWPPLILFLVKSRTSIAPFGSYTVAKTCKYRRTKTPLLVDGRAVLGRTGFTELALDISRVKQVGRVAHSYYGGHFPGNDDAMKLLCLVFNHAADEWKRPPREGGEAKSQFAVTFRERFVI